LIDTERDIAARSAVFASPPAEQRFPGDGEQAAARASWPLLAAPETERSPNLS